MFQAEYILDNINTNARQHENNVFLYLKGYRRYHSYSNNNDFSKLKILTPLKVTIVTKVTDITDIFSNCHNRYV